MQLSEEDVLMIRRYFTGKPVLKAYLFGSYSRGEAEADSDIDILVELDYPQLVGLGFVAMQLDLSHQLNKKVDMVSANGLSRHIAPFIHQDKKLIYER